MNWLTTILQAFGKPLQWWVVVAPWERGLRIRLGKVAALLEPGFHFRIPFLDRVYVQSVRLRTIYESGITISTTDGHVLILSIATDFCVKDIRALFDSLSAPEATLKTRVNTAAADYVSQRRREQVTPLDLTRCINDAISPFGCGLSGIEVRVMGFAFVRTYRLMINDYSMGADLCHGFDEQQQNRR